MHDLNWKYISRITVLRKLSYRYVSTKLHGNLIKICGKQFVASKHFRSNRPEVLCKKGVLRIFTKLTDKHMYQSLRPQACNFIKKDTLTQAFSCEFRKISKNTFSYRTPLVRLLLTYDNLLFYSGGFTAPLNYYRNLFTWETMKSKPKFYDMPSIIIWGTADPYM